MAPLTTTPVRPWAGAYPWHETHTAHYAAPPRVLVKDADPPPAAPHPQNDQSARAGVKTYAQFAAPYGRVDRSAPSDLKFYQMGGTGPKVDSLVKKHGYQVYYAGGKHGKPDLAGKNYNTGHLMIYDPSAGSGSDFGHEDYTANWRKIHELSHALTYPQLNQMYGEGRRIGGLGKQRTLREAKRAVHWEWLAAHKQRELAHQIGIPISDENFHRELNTVMHDAVHRAVTGKFTEPGDEGFSPHSHKVPLETALGAVDQSGRAMGLADDESLVRKAEAEAVNLLKRRNDVEQEYTPQQARRILATGLSERFAATAGAIRALREREFGRGLLKGELCLLCGDPEHPGECKVETLLKNADAGYSADGLSNDSMSQSEGCKECGGVGSHKTSCATGLKNPKTMGKGEPSPVHPPQNMHGQNLPMTSGGWPKGTEKFTSKPVKKGELVPDKPKVVAAQGSGGQLKKDATDPGIAHANKQLAGFKSVATTPAQHAADKVAAGVGFMNNIRAKIKGTGKANFAQVGGTGAKPRDRIGVGMAALSRAEYPAATAKSEYGSCALCKKEEHPGACM